MKSASTAACEIHTNVEPIRIRREAAVVETIERYKRQETNHPNRKLLEEPRPEQRIKKKCIPSVAENLKDKYKLPDEREQIHLFDISYNFDTQNKVPCIKI